ncbi:MAG: PIN domain-containing protein [Thermoplasmata archaeon]|nr:PIN domain-containing protein [Thermoplasmata archaeon]
MIFVDSGAWIALLDGRDGFHRAALAFQRELVRGRHGRLVTSDYVLDEAVTYLRRRGPVDQIRAFRELLVSSESVEVVGTAPERFWSAWGLLVDHGDNRWSLTDCVSFETMRALGIRTVFGFDADFRQAGFELLPSPG